MGFMDELKKLTQPYDDDDDFFEGASESEKSSAAAVSAAQMQFENAFAEQSVAPAEPEQAESAPARRPAENPGLFGRRPQQQPRQPRAPLRERTVNFAGADTQVILFNPKTFDEAGELVGHMLQGRSVVMTLEGLPTENARRLLDFMSGIAFALQGKITPVSAKTYFVTPRNVDVVGAGGGGGAQPESSGGYF